MDLNRIIITLDPERIIRVLSYPRENPEEAAILAGLIVVSAIIAIVLLVLLFGPQEPARTERVERASRDPEVERAKRRRSRLITWTLAVLVLGGLLVWGFRSAGATATCARCHGEVVPAEWSEGSHGSVACLRCHAGPGVMGVLAARLDVASDAGRRLIGISPRFREAVVADGSCSECHARQIAGTITVASIRVSHGEFLEAGYRCVECHAGVGHGVVAADRATPNMERCVPCHDGKTASSRCSTCHTGDVGVAGQTAMRDYPRSVDLGKPTTCRGCHEVDTCNECHGLELPHSAAFVESGHAKQAAFDGRALCAKCHGVYFCNTCHNFYTDGTTAHGPGFKNSHMSEPAQCSCHGKQSREEMCAVCH